MAHQIDLSMTHYISAAKAYPELSREQELRLITRWLGERDDAARDELVRSQLRYVIFIATKYRRYGLPISELVAEGNFGLVQALQKFDISRGTRFGAYGSHWIRAYILDHVIRSWSMVRGSGALRSKMFFKIRRERARILNLVGDGERADTLLAQALELPEAKVSAMVRSLEPETSRSTLRLSAMRPPAWATPWLLSNRTRRTASSAANLTATHAKRSMKRSPCSTHESATSSKGV